MSESILVATGTRLQCESCEAIGLISLGLKESMPPLVLECVCGKTYLHETQHTLRFPKMDPLLTANFQWKVWKVRSGKPNELQLPLQLAGLDREITQAANGVASRTVSQAVPEGLESTHLSPQTIPFSERNKELASYLLSAKRLIAAMRGDLENLGLQFEQELLRTLDESLRIRFGYNGEGIVSFMKKPWLSFAVPVVDEQLIPNTKLLAMPRFFDACYGIPLQSDGSYNLQLLCPYLRPTFPLESSLAIDLGVQPTPRLFVSGNKILGPDLLACHHLIPGTIYDDDHSPEFPSIRMQHPYLAKHWLMAQGVASWKMSPLEQIEYFPQASGASSLLDTPRYAHAWALLRHYGRLGLFWNSTEQMREFSLSVITAIKGYRMVITGSKLQTGQWREQYWGRLGQVGDANMLWHSWQDFKTLTHLSHIQLLIIDYQSGIPCEFIKRLLHFPGRVLILHNDPFMDLLEDNLEASALYTLAGWADIEPPAFNNTGGYRKELLPAGSLLGEVLQAIQGRKVPMQSDIASPPVYHATTEEEDDHAL